MHFNVARTAPDGLSTEEWAFHDMTDYSRVRVVLDSYKRATRPSKRHKFTVCARYERLNSRDHKLPLDSVPFPEDVVEEVRQAIIAGITISKDYTP